MLRLNAGTVEYVLADVAARIDGRLTDPTATTVSMCLLPEGTRPADGDWRPATWETDTTGRRPVYSARYLVDQPGPGAYMLWIRVEQPPETVIEDAGLILVN